MSRNKKHKRKPAVSRISNRDKIADLEREMRGAVGARERAEIGRKLAKLRGKEERTLDMKSSSGFGGIKNEGFQPQGKKMFISKAKLDQQRKECADLMKEARNQK